MDEAVKNRIIEWWENLDDRPGERNKLRKCESPEEVSTKKGFHRLRNDIYDLGGSFGNGQGTVLAGVLSHVRNMKSYDRMTTARLLGQADVHENRFQRLIEEEEREYIYRGLIRILPLLDRPVPESLIEDLYYWGWKVRRKWAADYYEEVL